MRPRTIPYVPNRRADADATGDLPDMSNRFAGTHDEDEPRDRDATQDAEIASPRARAPGRGRRRRCSPCAPGIRSAGRRSIPGIPTCRTTGTPADIDKADWAGLPQGRGGGLSRGPDRGRRQARRGGADTGQSLLRRQPDLSRQLRAGLEPLVHPRARRARGRRGRPAARADRFALQPAPHRARSTATAASSRWRSGCRATAPCRRR